MSFSIFTFRTRQLSTRLRLLGRMFHVSAAFWAFASLAATAVMVFRPQRFPYKLLPYFSSFTAVGLLKCASLYFIGNALLKRQRWGAYLGAITIGVPFVRQLLKPDAAILSVQDIVLSTVALCALVTVWPELGTLRDNDLVEDDEDDRPIVGRNRGYGEPRELQAPVTASAAIGIPAQSLTPDAFER